MVSSLRVTREREWSDADPATRTDIIKVNQPATITTAVKSRSLRYLLYYGLGTAVTAATVRR